MAFSYFDRVQETSATTGTGALSLGGAVTGFQTFASVYADGDTFYYTVQDQSGANWEVGLGTYTATGNKLTRTTVLASSNSGSLVGFAGATFIFVDVPAAQANGFYTASVIAMYGNGQDGALSISSGTTTLARDMFYTNLTISGTASIVPNGFRIFVNGTLDLSNAPAGAIVMNGAAGNNGAASGTTLGPIASSALGSLVGFVVGSTGAAGSTTSTAGSAGTATVLTACNGGVSGIAGASGASATGAAGTPVSVPAQTIRLFYNFITLPPQLINASAAIQNLGGGQNSNSAGGGAGDATAGASGASGSQGGAPIFIFARMIARGTNSTAGIIQSKGGNGATGGTAVAGIRGGGAGSGGSGGGWVYIIYDQLTGLAITGAIDVTGGNGGAGGNGIGIGGTGGGGGSSGSGGRLTIGNRLTGIITENTFSNVVVGNAASGATGGGAKTATTSQVNL